MPTSPGKDIPMEDSPRPSNYKGKGKLKQKPQTNNNTISSSSSSSSSTFNSSASNKNASNYKGKGKLKQKPQTNNNTTTNNTTISSSSSTFNSSASSSSSSDANNTDGPRFNFPSSSIGGKFMMFRGMSMIEEGDHQPPLPEFNPGATTVDNKVKTDSISVTKGGDGGGGSGSSSSGSGSGSGRKGSNTTTKGKKSATPKGKNKGKGPAAKKGDNKKGNNNNKGRGRGSNKGKNKRSGSKCFDDADYMRNMIEGGIDENIQDMVDVIKSRNSNNGGGRQAKGGTWLEEEDKALRQIVNEGHEGKWKAKAEELNSRMVGVYEEARIKAEAEGKEPIEYGRVAAQCLHRWKKVLQPGLNKGHWTKLEDDKVRATVRNAEILDVKIKWSNVAAMLPGRLGKQCRERWFNHLDPTVKKSEWTPREDEVLFNAQVYFSKRWCEISKLIAGRTENAVKNRFNSSARQRWQASAAGAAANGKTSKLFVEKLRATLEKSNEKKRALQAAPGAVFSLGAPPPPPSDDDKPAKKRKKAEPRTTTSKSKTKVSTPVFPSDADVAAAAAAANSANLGAGSGSSSFSSFSSSSTFASGVTQKVVVTAAPAATAAAGRKKKSPATDKKTATKKLNDDDNNNSEKKKKCGKKKSAGGGGGGGGAPSPSSSSGRKPALADKNPVGGKSAAGKPYKSNAGGRIPGGKKKKEDCSKNGDKENKLTGSPKKAKKASPKCDTTTKALAKKKASAGPRQPGGGKRESSTKKSTAAAAAAVAVVTPTKSATTVVAEIVSKEQQRPVVSRRGKDLMMKAGRLPPRANGSGSGSGCSGGGSGGGVDDNGGDGVRGESEWSADDARRALSNLGPSTSGKGFGWKSIGEKSTAFARVGAAEQRMELSPSRPPHLILQQPQPLEIEFAESVPSPSPSPSSSSSSSSSEVVAVPTTSTIEGPFPVNIPTDIQPLSVGLVPTIAGWSPWPSTTPTDVQEEYNDNTMDTNDFLIQDLDQNLSSSSVLPFAAPEVWHLGYNAGSPDGGGPVENDVIFAAGVAAASAGMTTAPDHGLWYGQNIGGGGGGYYGSSDNNASVKPAAIPSLSPAASQAAPADLSPAQVQATSPPSSCPVPATGDGVMAGGGGGGGGGDAMNVEGGDDDDDVYFMSHASMRNLQDVVLCAPKVTKGCPSAKAAEDIFGDLIKDIAVLADLSKSSKAGGIIVSPTPTTTSVVNEGGGGGGAAAAAAATTPIINDDTGADANNTTNNINNTNINNNITQTQQHHHHASPPPSSPPTSSSIAPVHERDAGASVAENWTNANASAATGAPNANANAGAPNHATISAGNDEMSQASVSISKNDDDDDDDSTSDYGPRLPPLGAMDVDDGSPTDIMANPFDIESCAIGALSDAPLHGAPALPPLDFSDL